MSEYSPDLKKFLVEQGYLSEAEFDTAAKDADERGMELGSTLAQRGLFSEDALARVMGEYYKVPYIDLKRTKIDLETLKLLPEDIARQKKVLLFKKDDKGAHAAVLNPGDLDTLQFLRSKLEVEIIPYITTKDALREGLIRYKATIAEDFDKIMEDSVKQAQKLKGSLDEIARDLPIVSMFDTIMSYAVAERAADIHIEPLKDEVLIRFRVDGILREIIKLPRSALFPLIARVKILANLRVDEHMAPQDGRFKVEIGDVSVALRVSTVPTYHGEKTVLRVLIEEETYSTLEALGLDAEQAKVLREEMTKPHGMLLLTGPTGSGKTTTLYTILSIRNTPEVNITTIEDPIEYDIKGVNQIQVNPAVELTFVEGLRSILRQSPDIIMVGEIRDNETARLAVNAALTGHLLMSTLHTNDAIGAVPRMLDLGIEAFLLASTLSLSMAQRLVRKNCVDCVKGYKLSDSEHRSITERVKANDPELVKSVPKEFYKGSGCNVCGHTGFRGRTGIFELFHVTSDIRALIAKGETGAALTKAAKAAGMVSMLEDGLRKVSAGTTTIEEVLRVVEE